MDTYCQIFGCLNSYRDGGYITLEFPELEVTKTPLVCQMHQQMLTETPELYDVSLTYRRDIEVRPKPAIPGDNAPPPIIEENPDDVETPDNEE